MAIRVLFAPTVHLLSRPSFEEPVHLAVARVGAAPPSAHLVEFAGRLCYMSQQNPAGRTTSAYVENLLAQNHGSVFEHATFSLLFEGVSRSLTHELVRHRAGFAYSQLSQRYVDESDTAFVIPPAYIGHHDLEEAFVRTCHTALDAYIALVDQVAERLDTKYSSVERRKRAREAARAALPNATETKIVVTANVRAWRHFIILRSGVGADQEMRRLARVVYQTLIDTDPVLFQGLTLPEP